jgi:hypothetical protein
MILTAQDLVLRSVVLTTHGRAHLVDGTWSPAGYGKQAEAGGERGSRRSLWRALLTSPRLLHLSAYSLLLVLTGFFGSGEKNAFFQTLNLALAALQRPHALKFGGAVSRCVQHVCGDRFRAAYGGCVDAEEG